MLGLLLGVLVLAEETVWTPGLRVLVEKAGTGHRAILLKVEPGRCFVAYEGEEERFDEWVETALVRPVKPPVPLLPAAPIAPATPLPQKSAEESDSKAKELPVWLDEFALPRPAAGAATVAAWLEPQPRSEATAPLRFNEARLVQPVFAQPLIGGITSAAIPKQVVMLPAHGSVRTGFAALEGNALMVYRLDPQGRWSVAGQVDTEIFGAHEMTGLTAGDLNNDGTLDLVVIGGPILQVYFATADGRYMPSVGEYRSHWPLRHVTTGRFFSGANPRGIAVVEGENTFRLLSASGTGIAVVGDAYNVNFDRILDLVAGDFDGDGYSDLALATETKGRSTGAWMYFNQNSAGQPFLWPVGGKDDFARALFVADLDHDGRDDLILTDNDADRGERVRIVFGSAGRSGWEDPWDLISSELGIGLGTASVVIGDFNRDGRPDIGVAGRNGLRIYLGADYRRFGRNPAWPVMTAGGGFPDDRAYLAVDLQGKGAVDLLGFTPLFATGYNVVVNATAEGVAGVFVPAPLKKKPPRQAGLTENKIERIRESPPGTPELRFLASRAEPYGPYRYRIVVEVAATDDGVVQAVEGLCRYENGGPLHEIRAQGRRLSDEQWSLEVVLPRGQSYDFTLTAHDDKNHASQPLRVVVSP